MSAEQRGNMLPPGVFRSEYIVHGRFKRSATDANGFVSAYWVALKSMRACLPRDKIDFELDIFENNVSTARMEELDAIEARLDD